MSFKKLHSSLLEALERLSIEEPTSFQKKSIPVIKSGAHVFCEAHKDKGKTTTYSSVRVYASYEQLHIDVQKSEIYMGIDVLITTPKTLHKLFLNNGVSISELKICSVDDAEFLIQKGEYTALISTTQSIRKCQYIVYAENLDDRIKRFEDHFMERARFVSA